MRILLACTLAVSTISCGTKTGEPVTADLALENGTSTSLLGTCSDLGGGFVPSHCYTPTSYGLKILNVVISPDESGAQTAPAGLIWINKNCSTTTSSSPIGEVNFEYESMNDCSDDQVTDFFELARSSDEVNKELNATPHKILPGTYNYVQIAFCIGGPKSKNASFKTADMTEAFEAKSGTYGISSVKADPPIVVEEGQSVTVSLSYDLANIIYFNEGGTTTGSDTCYASADGSVVRCFGFPRNLKPSFVQN